MKKQSFSTRLALYMTAVFGSMACFYILVVWALLPLVPQFAKYQTIILYVSAGIVQLIALPLLAVGQNVQSAASEKRMQKMIQHITNDNDRILKEVTEILKLDKNKK